MILTAVFVSLVSIIVAPFNPIIKAVSFIYNSVADIFKTIFLR